MEIAKDHSIFLIDSDDYDDDDDTSDDEDEDIVIAPATRIAASDRSKKRAEFMRKNPAPPALAAVLPAAAPGVTTAGRVVRPAKKLQDYYT